MLNRRLLAQVYLCTLAFALLGLTAIGLLDLLLGLAQGPRQLMLPSPTILTFLGLALLAGLLASLAALRGQGTTNSLSTCLDGRTLLAGCCGALLSTGSWYLLSLQNIHNLTTQNHLLLARLQDSIEDSLDNHLALITRMSQRWEALGSMPATSFWLQETGSYLRDLPSFGLVAVLDADLQVRRSRERDADSGHCLGDYLADPEQRSWLEQVRSGPQAQLSTARLQSDGAPKALVAVPLNLPGEPVQLLVACLDLRHVLSRLLDHGLGDFVIQVREGGRLLHSSLDSPALDLLGERPVGLEWSPRWTIAGYLDRAQAPRDSHSLALLVLLGGLLLSTLLMFSLRLTWLAQAQSRRLAEQQQYTDHQRRILGMISTLQPLPQILREICLLIEHQAPHLLSSVYQLDVSGQRLHLRAAPSLGERYCQAIASLPIGEGIGACGTAAFRREAVLVQDIPHDRRWKGFHHLAAAEGLHSCWSTPLLAGNGELLGTFAIYQRQPMRIDAELEALVATVSQLAAVAIEHRNTLDELERSNRELQEFAFVASHDLQEPLRKIQTFAEHLTSRTRGLDEQSRDYLQRMGSAAGRMQALIRDLLAYSRVHTRREPFVAVDLDALLDEVLQDLEGTLERSVAEIQREPLPHIKGDPRQLRQLLQNLLSNALKFHKPGETPKIRIYAERHDTGEWSLCIGDQGIGFDEKYLERIFQPFQRLHGRQAYPGTGIGLAIVRKIAERHGARLSAHSAAGAGATFCVTFPVAAKE